MIYTRAGKELTVSQPHRVVKKFLHWTLIPNERFAGSNDDQLRQLEVATAFGSISGRCSQPTLQKKAPPDFLTGRSAGSEPRRGRCPAVDSFAVAQAAKQISTGRRSSYGGGKRRARRRLTAPLRLLAKAVLPGGSSTQITIGEVLPASARTCLPSADLSPVFFPFDILHHALGLGHGFQAHYHRGQKKTSALFARPCTRNKIKVESRSRRLLPGRVSACTVLGGSGVCAVSIPQETR
jgi:hypothetical protein